VARDRELAVPMDEGTACTINLNANITVDTAEFIQDRRVGLDPGLVGLVDIARERARNLTLEFHRDRWLVLHNTESLRDLVALLDWAVAGQHRQWQYKSLGNLAPKPRGLEPVVGGLQEFVLGLPRKK
jgi:hypothetical protein